MKIRYLALWTCIFSIALFIEPVLAGSLQSKHSVRLSPYRHLHFRKSITITETFPNSKVFHRRGAVIWNETSFQPPAITGDIDWSALPEFTLPENMIAVYEGPHFNRPDLEPLAHGFSHIADRGTTAAGRTQLLPEQRAALIYNLANHYYVNPPKPQPWQYNKIPWDNDLLSYEQEWDARMRQTAAQFPESGEIPDVDLLVVDIERHWSTDTEILACRENTAAPVAADAMSDDEFILQYQKDITELYGHALSHLKDFGYQGALSSYSDVPIPRTFWEIPNHSWDFWTQSDEPANYLLQDFDDSSTQYGPVEENIDFLTPSAYYHYDYPDTYDEDPADWDEGGDYLAYLLFQVEVNKARSDKDVIPFVWMQYHDQGRSAGRILRPHVAQASAIFPFFSGAKGVWLWEGSAQGTTGDPNWDYSAYLNFAYGLYRISFFADMFEGDYELIAPTPPNKLMEQNLPVWRAVVKDGKMLVAAQNPYAQPNEHTIFRITYKNRLIAVLPVIGQNTALALYPLPSPTR